MKNLVSKFLENSPLMVLDGGLATELEHYGCNLDDHLWSAKALIEHKDLICRVHLDYLEAGADCISTASYQATLPGFIESGMSYDTASQLIETASKLALQARNFHTRKSHHKVQPLVAASIGPYGAYLHDGSEYTGDYEVSDDKLVDFHLPRARILANTGIDLFAFETLPNIAEARALLRVLREFPSMTAWFSFSARDGSHISSGEHIYDCVELLKREPQVAAIGINCTAPRLVTKLVRLIRSKTKKPIVVYPNSGETYHAQGKTWHGVSDYANFSKQAREWFEAGANLIGGCCRTRPGDIRAIARQLKKN